MPRGVKKENLPWKLCEVCQRPFTWRKVWERCWDDVKTCSDRCKAERKKQNKAKKEEESNSGSTQETSYDARQMVKMDKGAITQIISFAGIPLHLEVVTGPRVAKNVIFQYFIVSDCRVEILVPMVLRIC